MQIGKPIEEKIYTLVLCNLFYFYISKAIRSTNVNKGDKSMRKCDTHVKKRDSYDVGNSGFLRQVRLVKLDF